MKKIFFLSLLLAVFFSFPAFAEESKQCPPGSGCDCGPDGKSGVLGIMKNQAEVKQAEDSGNTKEIVKKPAKGKELVCLDKALALLTGFLGNAFSNNVLQLSPSQGANNTAFCGLVSYPSLPSLNLAMKLALAMPDLSGLIPGFSIRYCMPPFPPLPPISASMGGSLGTCNISTSVGFTPQMPGPLCGELALPGYQCDAIKKLWSGGPDSIEGSGVTAGTAYMNLKTLLQTQSDKYGEMPQGTKDKYEAMGESYKKQMENNSAKLKRAWEDLKKLKDPEQPDGLKSWKPSPMFGAQTNVQDILDQIEAGK